MGQKVGSDYAIGPYTFKALAAIVQGQAVKLTAVRGEVEVCDSQGEVTYGIALQTVAAGEPLSVLRRGRFDKAIAGEALATPHTPLTVGADGRYEAAAADDVICGFNLTTAAADGDPFTIELEDAQRVEPAAP